MSPPFQRNEHLGGIEYVRIDASETCEGSSWYIAYADGGGEEGGS
jgi:hypothetical protein